MRHNYSSFKWRRFESSLILLCVRWYCRFQLSYHDVEEMMRERGHDEERSGQKISGGDSQGQAKFVAALFRVAA